MRKVAVGVWESGEKLPAAGGKGVWGRSQFLQFFNENNSFLCIFRSK